MSMLLEVKRILWSIIGDSGCIVTSVWCSTPALHASHMSTGNLGTRPVEQAVIAEFALGTSPGHGEVRQDKLVELRFRQLTGIGVVVGFWAGMGIIE
jgi:hypothetical protein